MKRDELLEWSRLEVERRDLSRQLASIRQRQQQLEESFEAALTASGKTSIRRHGFVLAMVPGRANVSWSAEFLKACGHEAAQQIKDAAAAKAKSVFVITPPESIEPTE